MENKYAPTEVLFFHFQIRNHIVIRIENILFHFYLLGVDGLVVLNLIVSSDW